jgi:hypothetical protein
MLRARLSAAFEVEFGLKFTRGNSKKSKSKAADRSVRPT